jgi:hypothetical protein
MVSTKTKTLILCILNIVVCVLTLTLYYFTLYMEYGFTWSIIRWSMPLFVSDAFALVSGVGVLSNERFVKWAIAGLIISILAFLYLLVLIVVAIAGSL